MEIILRRSDIYENENADAPAQSTLVAIPVNDKVKRFIRECIKVATEAPHIVCAVTCSDILDFTKEVMFWDYTPQENGEIDIKPFENFTEEALDALAGVDLHIWELLEDYGETIIITDSTMEILKEKMKGYGVRKTEGFVSVEIDKLWTNNQKEITQFMLKFDDGDEYGAGYILDVKDILGEK